MRHRLVLILVLALGLLRPAGGHAETAARGMWVWSGSGLIRDRAEQSHLLQEAARIGVTDLYLYIPTADYRTQRNGLQAFLRRAARHDVAVWGLDGCRCYFHDADGPQALYAMVDALISYNVRAAADARFAGFQTDNEPHDQGGYPASFHNGLADSQLSTSGGGVWQKTEADDREMLLRDWLRIQKTVDARLRRAGLRSSAAMVSYTEDYYGEPLTVTFAGKTTTAGRHMMRYVDDYVIMTYNTDPANAAARAAAQAAYASKLPSRPRIFASVETNTGVGDTISYGDTPGKQSKTVVLRDIAAIAQRLRRHAAFAGVGIHSWEGWKVLPD